MNKSKKVISNYIEKLDNDALEHILGGGDVNLEDIASIAVIGSVFSTPISLVLGVSSSICRHRSKKRREQGNIARAEKLEKAEITLNRFAIGSSAVGTIGALMLGGIALHDHFS